MEQECHGVRVNRKRWTSRLEKAVGHLRAFAHRVKPVPAAVPPRIGLALGGGFARGIAHIGVLKVLEENQIRPDCLAGTSAGSIIAGAYATGVPVDEMAAVARKVRWQDFGRWTFSRMGLASNHRLEGFVGRVFRSRCFEDLEIPLAVVATDLMAGRGVVFTSGELALALRASCAYPGLFLPVAYNGTWLADGGLVAMVPTEAARKLGADVVVAVSLENMQAGLEPKSVMDVLGRAFSIAQHAAECVWRERADIVVEPGVSEFRWDDFERADELIAAGEQAMREALPGLRRLVQPVTASRAAAL